VLLLPNTIISSISTEKKVYKLTKLHSNNIVKYIILLLCIIFNIIHSYLQLAKTNNCKNNDIIPLKYENRIGFVKNYWDRKEVWCLAFRDASIHGNTYIFELKGYLKQL
jgi:hypothetical protein